MDLGGYYMFLNREAAIARIDYRIKILRARGEMLNMKIIAALEREKRNLEAKADA